MHLRNVQDWTPDPERYDYFDNSLRYAFQQETELFIANMIKEDRSILDLIDADYTFVSAWEYAKKPSESPLHKEVLEFENIELKQRSYK